MDFPARAPGGEERLVALAESIAREPGLIWKIWT
ncbi:MAG: YdhR family protein, partial [Alphaproteobacteria bacterium]|nr:YdhR family protein [Alphaproteobacteria bacterium]